MKAGKLIWFLLLTPLLALSQPAEKACFSVPGGFYQESPVLEIYPIYQQHHIRYTVNGNRPTAASPLFAEPLLLDESLYSTSDIYTIQISPDDLVFVPDSVQHCIVIRAAVFDENDSCVSPVATNSYFIHALGCDTHGFPAVSICADSLDLFDYEQGILVPGIHFNPEQPNQSGNYYMHGQEWEREVNFEFCEPLNNEGLNQICGLRTHGNRSRRYPAKGMKVYAREEYGNKRFDYNFFNDSLVDSYKHLVLKPFASFWPYSGAQDYFCNKIALQLGLPSSDSRPVVVYLNGEYWGVYFIQEKMDERFLEDHFGTNIHNCNIIGDWHGNADCGNPISFNQMMGWLNNADLHQDANYRHLCNLIDVDNFIDYIVFETFIANYDWPGNNMRCWQEGDSKWRWIFFDGDATLTYNEMDVFANAAVFTPPATWANYPEAKLMFGKLLENPQFRTVFEERMVQLCEGLFRYENLYPVFHDMVEALRPHIEDQGFRFGYPSSMDYWNRGNAHIYNFLERRVGDYLQWWHAFAAVDEIPGASMVVYPNPCTGEIHVRLEDGWSEASEWAVYDLLGRKVFSDRLVSESKEITLHLNLPAGAYFLRIDDRVTKFVIQ